MSMAKVGTDLCLHLPALKSVDLCVGLITLERGIELPPSLVLWLCVGVTISEGLITSFGSSSSMALPTVTTLITKLSLGGN